MDKLKYVKLENPDGSYSDSIPLAVDANYVFTSEDTNLTEDLNSIKNINQNQNIEIDEIKNNLSQETNNRTNSDLALQTQINKISSGSPLVAGNISDMQDTSRIYVNTTDGYWYYYNGSTWAQGGIYQATGIPEKEITYPKINLTGTVSKKVSEKHLGYIIDTQSPSVKKYSDVDGYSVYVFDVEGWYDQGITKIPISIKNGVNYIRILRSNTDKETMFTSNQTTGALIYNETETSFFGECELISSTKTLVVMSGAYSEPEIFIGISIEKPEDILFKKTISNGLISDEAITPEKTNFLENNFDKNFIVLHHSFRNPATSPELDAYKIKYRSNSEGSLDTYFYNVENWYNEGKKYVIMNISGNITQVLVGRSGTSSEEIISEITNSESATYQEGFSVSKVYYKGNIDINEQSHYKVAIPLYETTKSIMVHCGKNSSPIISIGTERMALKNSKAEDYISIEDYPKCDNDSSDSERIQRCFDENSESTIFFPKKDYYIDETIQGEHISMLCDNQAHFIGSLDNYMFIITYRNTDHRHYSVVNGYFDCNNIARAIKLQRRT